MGIPIIDDLTGKNSSKAASQAAALQAQATDRATAENTRQFDIGQANLAPWLSAGKGGLSAQQDLMGLGRYEDDVFDQQGYDAAVDASGMARRRGGSIFSSQNRAARKAPNKLDFTTKGKYIPGDMSASLAALQSSPGYQFRLKQGRQGLDAGLAAMGGMGSGRAMKAGIDYNQNFASNEYGNRLSQLAGLSGTGQATGAGMAGQGMQYANTQGNLWTNNANAQGAAGIAGANARQSGLYNLLSLGAMGYGAFKRG